MESYIIAITEQLEEFLQDYKKLIIMGVGNELKADDGLGPYFIQILSQDLKDIAAELEKDLKDKKEHTIETTELSQDLKGIASTLEKPKQRKRKDDSIDDNGFYRSGKKRGKK